MYFPSGVRYPDMGITDVSEASESDVLDLCTRKPDKIFGGDVNGNDYAENSNSFYKSYDRDEKAKFRCKSPEVLLRQRFVRPVLSQSDPESISSALILQEKVYSDVSDRVHASAESSSTHRSQIFSADSPVSSGFLPGSHKIPSIATRNGKPTRPFKAYPKDFLTLATSEGLLDDSSKRYMEFRRQFLTQLHGTTGLPSNKNMKRPVQSDSPNQLPSSSGDTKDQAYWERRKKNNEAAKKSRDARRAKEDEIAIRAAFLERENVRLKLELASLRSETDRLRCMLYTS